jgi:DNA invertase Pin-like site-specific DNA recombinase
VSGKTPQGFFEQVYDITGGRMGLQIVDRKNATPRKVLAAVYARVSTLNGGQDSTMQTRELSEYCHRRGWTVHDIYVDEGVSGKKDSRPELNRMMKDAHERRFDVVVCWRFDRFSRSVSHLCRALETFNALDIQFVSLCEQVDTNTPTGKLVFTILGAVAEGERNLIAERVRSGLRNARAKGKRLGRPKKCVDVDRINALRASGHSWRTIAGMMKLSVGTVYAAAQSQQRNALCA